MNKTIQPDVSVIVCAYNVQRYIKACLESILRQTHKNFECIIINDGSTDQTEKVILSLIDGYENARLISQPNAGVLSSRITGIHASRGKYIIFVDADDWLELNAIETLYHRIEENQCDMLRCRNYIEYGETIGHSPIVFDIPTILECTQIENAIYKLYTSHDVSCIWNQIIKREMFCDFEFTYNCAFGDDLYLNMHLYKTCKKMMYIPDELWHYRNYGESITRTKDAEKMIKNFKDCQYIYSRLYYEVDHNINIIHKDFYKVLALKRYLYMMKNRLQDLYLNQHPQLQPLLKDVLQCDMMSITRATLKKKDCRHLMKFLYKGDEKQIMLYLKYIYRPFHVLKRFYYGK